MRGWEKRGGRRDGKRNRLWTFIPSPTLRSLTWESPGCLHWLTAVTVKCTKSRSLQSTIKLPVWRGQSSSSKPLGLRHLNQRVWRNSTWPRLLPEDISLHFWGLRSSSIAGSLEEGFFSVKPSLVWLLTATLNELQKQPADQLTFCYLCKVHYFLETLHCILTVR